jgi:hypothetical protein
MNWKGVGKKRSWINFKVVSKDLPGRTEKKLRKPSVRIAGLRTEILTQHFPNGEQEC